MPDNDANPTAASASLLIDIREVARLLGISPATAHRLHAAGRLPKPIRFKPGNTVRWSRASLERFVTASEQVGRLLSREEFEKVHGA